MLQYIVVTIICGLVAYLLNNVTAKAVLYGGLVNLRLFAILFVGKKHTIGRPEGVFFLLSYIAYTVYLLLRG